jgi:hypothetical protein
MPRLLRPLTLLILALPSPEPTQDFGDGSDGSRTVASPELLGAPTTFLTAQAASAASTIFVADVVTALNSAI